MVWKRVFLTLLIYAGIPGVLAAQSPTLELLLQLMEQRNPALQALQAGARAEAWRPDQVGALPDPTVGISYLPLPVVTARGEQRSQWRLEQAFPFPGTLRLRKEQAIARSEASKARYEDARVNLAYLLQRTYYTGYRIAETRRYILEYQQQLTLFEEAATSLYSVGKSPQQAILKAQLERNTLENRLLQLSRQEADVRQQLRRLLNDPSFPTDTLSWQLPPWDALPSADSLVALAFARHPEVRRLTAEAEAARKQIALRQKRFYPDFKVSLQYIDIANRGPTPSTTGQNALAIGVGLRLPLQRRALHAGLEEARLRLQQVQHQLEDLRTQLQTAIYQRVEQLEEVDQQLELLREMLLPQADMTLEATLAAYQTGRASFLDLLDAERMRFSLQLQRIELTQERFVLRAALARLTGRTRI